MRRNPFFWGATLWLASIVLGMASSPGTELALGRGAYRLVFNTNGALVAWAGQIEPTKDDGSSAAGEVRYRGKTLRLESPEVTRAADYLSLAYRWKDEPGLEVIVQHQVMNRHRATVWEREMQVRGDARLASDLTISLQSWPRPLPSDTWLPLVNGTGAVLGTNEAADFHLAGALPGPGAALALPLVSLPAPARRDRILIAADPYFSARFKSGAVEWTYPAKAGLESGCERRTLVVAVHPGSVEESLRGFFRDLLPEVAPGPAWLHEIAMVDFDYLSDQGQGWFRDINALTNALGRADRHKVFLCLHGWYDFLGRYCFDAKTGQLDRQWTAFSSYERAKTAPAFGNIGGARVEMGFGNCKPKAMSLAEVHQRLQYARTRGFRAGLYFADGVNAGDGLPDFDPSRVLQWGGWQGPDSKGRSYLQNPLHPAVHAFYVNYVKALLAEFGPNIDALVWDETFHVACGQLGTEAWPGCADRAMMRLVRKITSLVEDYNRQHRRQIAFLTSDCLGAFGGERKAPYALVSHGTYQDSWCQPRAWSYGIFANYRNVLWSCCWWPVSKWPWVEFGVRAYQAPVAISNGWGNDKGFAELTPAQRDRVLQLFNWRKQHTTRLKWFDHLPPEPQ